MASFDLITLDYVSDTTEHQSDESSFATLEEIFSSNVDPVLDSNPKVKGENTDPSQDMKHSTYESLYPDSLPDFRFFQPVGSTPNHVSSKPSGVTTPLYQKLDIMRSQPVHTSTVPQSAGAPNMNYSDFSPEFLQARREALCLGLQGEHLANYVLCKLKQNQVLQVANQPVSPTVSGPKIRLEKWKLKEENFETFLHRFERLASDLSWSEDIKLLHLISCLEGKALEIYRRCDRERRVSYGELCKQLDQAFAETATEKAKKFTESKLDLQSEMPSQYAVSLREKFLAWFRKANPGRQVTMDNLLNHIVREKLLESLPERLKILIAQKELLDVEEIAEFSDRFFEAQKNHCSHERKNQDSKGATGRNLVSAKKQDQKKELKCFVCKSNKHIAKHCTYRQTASAALETAAASTVTLPTSTATPTSVESAVTQTEDLVLKGSHCKSQGAKRKQNQTAKGKGNK